MSDPLLVSAPDAAKMLGISRSLFYEMLSVSRCPLHPVKFGKRKLFRVDQLTAWVESGCSTQWEAGK